MTLSPGSLLNNRYRIQNIIAEGGMGAVYLASDESLNIHVAVKENFFTGEEYTRQFRREATMLASLRHPNLPRVTDHFVISGQGQYLVMDYIEGEDLRGHLKSHGPFSEAEAIRIGATVCDALQYLHSRQPHVVHRDIKPGNVKVTPHGEIFLVDFGLAKFFQPGEMTSTAAQGLTPGYSPPEQYGEGTDTRSDIYSLGATMFAAMTGKAPEDALKRLMENLSLTPLRAYNPSLSEGIQEVIEKAMSMQRDDRFQTAQEFKHALLALGAAPTPVRVHEQPAAPPSTPVHPVIAPPTVILTQPVSPPSAPRVQPAAAKGPRRWLLGLLAAGGIGMVLLAGGVFGIYWAFFRNPAMPVQTVSPSISAPISSVTPGSQPTKPPMENPTTPATAQAAALNTPAGGSSSPTGSLSTAEPTLAPTPAGTPQGGGGRIAFTSERSGKPQVWVMNPDGSNPSQVTQMPDGACQPDWSPDGAQIVFTSPCASRTLSDPAREIYINASLFLIRPDGSGLKPLRSVPGGDFDPAWSPDGRSIAFSSLRSGLAGQNPDLFLYLLDEDRVIPVTKGLPRDRHPSWSPDGKWLVFQREQQQRQIWTVDGLGETPPRIFSSDISDFTSMPDWSSAELIVFSQGKSFPGLYSHTAGDPKAPETRFFDGPAWHPRFSPDGSWIVFEGIVFDGEKRNYEIFIFAWNGGTPRLVVSDPAADYHPAWGS